MMRHPRTIDVAIIGAGHNGLAMSAELTRRSIEHVVLERHEVASSWRRRRWDSFRLLTPNAQSVLPGTPPPADPDGFMTAAELAATLQTHADTIDAPVVTGVEVERVSASPVGGYLVETLQGPWRAEAVVVASGPAELVGRPECSATFPDTVCQLDSLDYRNPDQLPDAPVLVVGGAASGLQIAEEVQASGRPVTMSVGEHVRMVRAYRGRDIHHWMDVVGIFDEGLSDVESIAKARRVSSPQLVGSPERRNLDLAALHAAGVEITGRLATVRDGNAVFAASLRNHCTLADQKLSRLLDRIDEWIDGVGAAPDTDARPEPVALPRASLSMDLRDGRVGAVVWATGVRPDHRFLDLPVFDDRGRLDHHGGVVTGAPGVVVLGLPFLRRRRSTFISGAGPDAADLADHVATVLARSPRRR